MTARDIEVRIDELVLHGVAACDRQRVAAAFTAELTRLLQRDRRPAPGIGAAADRRSFALPSGHRPEDLGARAARAVHREVAP